MGSRIFLICLSSLFFSSCAYKLASYEPYLVGTPVGKDPKCSDQVTVTYLGTSGYLFEHEKTAIVIDPYFSRYDLRTIILNGPIPPKCDLIEEGAGKGGLPKNIDGWLITHAHFDHAMDIPWLQKHYGGTVYSSGTGDALMRACGVSPSCSDPVTADQCLRIGEAKVTVLQGSHDRIFGQIPYPGHLSGDVPAPQRARDWRVGEPLAYLIEMGGKRIYVESGGMGHHLPAPQAKGVDLAILGVAVPDSQVRYPEALKFVCPEYVLPSHQDHFFVSMEPGFRFSPTANFPTILAHHQAGEVPGKLVLMEYFHEWSLP
jgi:L-ascorbate metabolism protein UlaG (beta-lactamase superfamily)